MTKEEIAKMAKEARDWTHRRLPEFWKMSCGCRGGRDFDFMTHTCGGMHFVPIHPAAMDDVAPDPEGAEYLRRFRARDVVARWDAKISDPDGGKDIMDLIDLGNELRGELVRWRGYE